MLKCGHLMAKKCSQKDSEIVCNHICESLNNCGNHKCQSVCGPPHSHHMCNYLVAYDFPDCKHPSPRRKKCSESVTWKCKTEVDRILSKCGHKMQK